MNSPHSIQSNNVINDMSLDSSTHFKSCTSQAIGKHTSNASLWYCIYLYNVFWCLPANVERACILYLNVYKQNVHIDDVNRSQRRISEWGLCVVVCAASWHCREREDAFGMLQPAVAAWRGVATRRGKWFSAHAQGNSVWPRARRICTLVKYIPCVPFTFICICREFRKKHPPPRDPQMAMDKYMHTRCIILWLGAGGSAEPFEI